MKKRESILSLIDAKGTTGYITLEAFSRMYDKVSNESDVHSYEMLVFGMSGARNKNNNRNY